MATTSMFEGAVVKQFWYSEAAQVTATVKPAADPGGYPCMENAVIIFSWYVRHRIPISRGIRQLGHQQAYFKWREAWMRECLQQMPPYVSLPADVAAVFNAFK